MPDPQCVRWLTDAAFLSEFTISHLFGPTDRSVCRSIAKPKRQLQSGVNWICHRCNNEVKRDANGQVIYDHGVELLDTWRALERLVEGGKCEL